MTSQKLLIVNNLLEALWLVDIYFNKLQFVPVMFSFQKGGLFGSTTVVYIQAVVHVQMYEKKTKYCMSLFNWP